MDFVKQLPPAHLADIVKYFWFFKLDENKLPYSQIAFPYGAFELIYYLQNPNKMQWLGSNAEFYEPKLFYAGQLTQPYMLKFEKPCICAGISLQPWAGNILFDVPAHHFKNELTELNNLTHHHQIADELSLCQSPKDVFNCFEKYIFNKTKNKRTDAITMALAKSILVNPGYENFENSFVQIGLGRRRIEQRFNETVGLNMSMFLKKTRFHHAIQMMVNKKDNKLADISFELGYYDQAHFVHDFKRFAGVSPTQYLNSTEKGLNNFLETVSNPMA